MSISRMISRAKNLCSVVHVQETQWQHELNFSMEVRGSNGTAKHTFSRSPPSHVIEQTNKNASTEVLHSLSDLEIGTISKVTFINVNDSNFVENVINELQMKGIYLWTLNDNGAELLFKVLKSSTTAAEYQAMLNKYNDAQPGLTKVKKKVILIGGSHNRTTVYR